MFDQPDMYAGRVYLVSNPFITPRTGGSLGCAPGCDAEGREFETPTGPTLRVFKLLRRKCCLCNFICKWLVFLVFSDKDDKSEVPSHNSLNVDNSVGRKRTTHYSKRVGWSRCCGCLSYANRGVGEVGHLWMGPWSPLVPFPSGQL